MAKQKRSRGKTLGRLFVVLIIVALILGAAYLLNRCGMGGFGLGTGNGPGSGPSGTPSSSASSSARPAPSASSSAAQPDEPFQIRVTGTGCRVGSTDEAASCDDACAKADEATQGRHKREVRLNPSKGSQDVVERLKKCLADKGLGIVEAND